MIRIKWHDIVEAYIYGDLVTDSMTGTDYSVLDYDVHKSYTQGILTNIDYTVDLLDINTSSMSECVHNGNDFCLPQEEVTAPKCLGLS